MSAVLTSSAASVMTGVVTPTTTTSSPLDSSSGSSTPIPTFKLELGPISDPIFGRNSPIKLSWDHANDESPSGDPELYSGGQAAGGDGIVRDADGVPIHRVTNGSAARPINTSPLSRDSVQASPTSLECDRPDKSAADWISEKLARDLDGIMPTFDFDFSTTSFASRPTFSSTTSESSEENISYTCSDFEEKEPRHSWAGSKLDIIDSSTLDLRSSTLKSEPKSHRNSFDWSFRMPKSEIGANGTLRRSGEENCRYRFESDSPSSAIGEFVCRKNPLLRYLSKTLRPSTDLILESEFLIIKFKRRNDYLCSSIGVLQKKVVIHLLDVVNVVVLTGSSTIIVQFRQTPKTLSLKERSKIYRLSASSRSSKSNSLNRSISSESGEAGEVKEVEVGQFPEQCMEIAHLILQQKQVLLPRGILKSCSVRVKTEEPIVVMPLELTCSNQSNEVMEWMTNV